MNSYSFYDSNGVVVHESHKAPDADRRKPTKTRPRAAAKDKKIILYSIFKDMIKYTDDTFWITKLINWSNGKPCNRYKYNDNSIRYNKATTTTKSNIIKIELFPDDLERSFSIFKSFLETHSKEVSEQDRIQRANNEGEEYVKARQGATKSTKNTLSRGEDVADLINRYVADTLGDTQHTPKLARSLKDAVKLVILTKNKKNITFDATGTYIVNVSGIEKDPSTDSFELTIDKIKPPKVSKKVILDSDDDEPNRPQCDRIGGNTDFLSFLTKACK